MNTVERIKFLCSEKKIPISKLEKDLGFANGYIGQLKKGTVPDDRAIKIAGYLEVSVSYLTTGKESSLDLSGSSAHLLAKLRNDKQLKDVVTTYLRLSKEQRKHVYDLVLMLDDKK